MTEEYAVILSYRVWHWLWKNPGKGKEDCPWWDLLEKMHKRCPCCEYYPRGCKGCILDIIDKPLCAGGAYDKWFHDRTNRAASWYIAVKLRRYARKKEFDFNIVKEES